MKKISALLLSMMFIFLHASCGDKPVLWKLVPLKKAPMKKLFEIPENYQMIVY